MLKAIAVFNGKKIKGTVVFTEDLVSNSVIIDINLQGLHKNALHGFHVHQAGDLTDQCESMCAHFNPYGKKHGCPGQKERHVGDLGNLIANSSGCAKYRMIDNVIKLRGKCNIIGRGLIIHQDEDDCGKGENEDSSLINGNAGKRIGCAIIGWHRS